MKKAVGIFLLSIFLFNTVGYYFIFKATEYQLKYKVQFEIKSGIDSDELKTLTFNKNNLRAIEWLESGKEMRYNNKLYDIVRSTETSSTITYYCINDTKEESLFSNLEDHINTHIAANQPIKNDNQKKITDNVIKLYFSNEQSFKFNVFLSFQHHFISINSSYTSTVPETDSPPPEFV